ncbi:MAG TPA: GNAT family N-acetyltransferase [Streptosporangiaceae bacterium]|nr:GNAT family N-acetyltransferase [Streptosporangiaceae bacterium]
MTISSSALAAYDSQVRQSTLISEPGVRAEADGTIVRWVATDDQGSSWITWSRLDAGNADAVIAAQVEFFRARRQQVEWKLYDYDQPADLGQRLAAAGFVPDETEALMVTLAAEVAGEVPLPDGVTIRQVAGEAGVAQVADLHERVFGRDQSRLRESLLAQVRSSPASVEMVVAFAGDEPVCAARVEFPPGTEFAGLWGGGTLPQWRGRGLYRATVACRARLATARGYRYLQVDALPTSAPILARLGFTELARTTPYIWDPDEQGAGGESAGEDRRGEDSSNEGKAGRSGDG